MVGEDEDVQDKNVRARLVRVAACRERRREGVPCATATATLLIKQNPDSVSLLR